MNVCKRCRTSKTHRWWKCCPEHTPERNLEVMCDRCAKTLHPEMAHLTSDEPQPDLVPNELIHDHDKLVNVLIYHYRKNDSSCGCGWAELGKSHAEHVVIIYEETLKHF